MDIVRRSIADRKLRSRVMWIQKGAESISLQRKITLALSLRTEAQRLGWNDFSIRQGITVDPLRGECGIFAIAGVRQSEWLEQDMVEVRMPGHAGDAFDDGTEQHVTRTVVFPISPGCKFWFRPLKVSISWAVLMSRSTALDAQLATSV